MKETSSPKLPSSPRPAPSSRPNPQSGSVRPSKEKAPAKTAPAQNPPPTPPLPPEKELDVQDVVKKLTAPLFGLIGSVAGIYQFINLYRGDRETVTIITGSLGYVMLWIAMLYISFSTRAISPDRQQRALRYAPYHILARGVLVGLLFMSLVGLVWLGFYQKGYRIVLRPDKAAQSEQTASIQPEKVQGGVMVQSAQPPDEPEPASASSLDSVAVAVSGAAAPEQALEEPSAGEEPLANAAAPDKQPASVLYEWNADTGWDCWVMPYSSGKKPKPYGANLISRAGSPLAFLVDFEKAAQNQGRIMYAANRKGCPALQLPSNASLHATLNLLSGKASSACQPDNKQRILKDELAVNAAFFVQTATPEVWMNSLPLVGLNQQDLNHLQAESWVVTETSHAATLKEGQNYSLLGLLFDVDQDKKLPSGAMCFSVERVWVEAP